MGHDLSVHQSGSDRCLAKAIGFAPNAFCDGFVLHRVLARGLQFNPQALDACQTMTVFSDSGTAGQGGSIRQNEQVRYPLCSYADRPAWLASELPRRRASENAWAPLKYRPTWAVSAAVFTGLLLVLHETPVGLSVAVELNGADLDPKWPIEPIMTVTLAAL
jgi:hypothetical protein